MDVANPLMDAHPDLSRHPALGDLSWCGRLTWPHREPEPEAGLLILEHIWTHSRLFTHMSKNLSSKTPRRTGKNATAARTPKKKSASRRKLPPRDKRPAPVPPAAARSRARRAKPVPTPSFALRGTKHESSGRTISAPVASSTQMHHSEPVMRQTRHGMIVRHSELIGTLTGFANLYTTLQFAINPGLAASFPWLSSLAVKFQQYRFKHLRVWFITRASTDTEGSILLAPSYVPSNGDPPDEETLSAYEGAVEGSAWSNLVVDLLPELLHSTGSANFVRSGYVAAALDLYDCAKIFIATLGFAAELAAGKIWIDYEVELMVPVVRSDTQVYPLAAAKFRMNTNSIYQNDGWVDLLSDAKTGDEVETVFNSLGMEVDTGLGEFTMPDEGWYRVICKVTIGVPTAADLTTTYPNSDSRAVVRMLVNGASNNAMIGTSSAVALNGTFTAHTTTWTALKYIPAGAVLIPGLYVTAINKSNSTLTWGSTIQNYYWYFQRLETGGVPPPPSAPAAPIVLARAPQPETRKPIERVDPRLESAADQRPEEKENRL